MYRIGILGTENSHAAAFADLVCKNRDEYSDFQLTALYALEKAPSEAIASKYPTENIKICDSVEEMLPLVDCVMITARHGKYHKDFAMPFIKAGMPAFIDKPFAITISDAEEIIDAAKQYNAPLSGGSGLKYSPEMLSFISDLKAGVVGNVTSAMFTFSVDLDSVYGGLYFYAGHLTEMMTSLFGGEVRSIKAFKRQKHLMAVARYDSVDVVMNFENKYTAAAFGDKGYIMRDITCDHIYDGEFNHFVEMVRTGVSSTTVSELVAPVRIMNAIERSILTGREEIV